MDVEIVLDQNHSLDVSEAPTSKGSGLTDGPTDGESQPQ